MLTLCGVIAVGAGLLVAAAPANADVGPSATQPFTIQSAEGDALPPVGGPTPVSPDTCSPDPTYTSWSPVTTWLGDPSRKTTGMGPMTLSVSVTNTDTTTSVFTTTVGVSASGIVASAHADISASIQMSVAAGTTLGATWQPAAGRLGWLEWGNWAIHYYWSYGHYAGCTWTVINGRAVSPRLSGKGFNYGYS